MTGQVSGFRLISVCLFLTDWHGRTHSRMEKRLRFLGSPWKWKVLRELSWAELCAGYLVVKTLCCKPLPHPPANITSLALMPTPMVTISTLSQSSSSIEICIHLSEEGSKKPFFEPEKLENHTNEGKRKEKKGRARRKKGAMVAHL